MTYEAEIDGPVCPECGGNHATDQAIIDQLNARLAITPSMTGLLAENERLRGALELVRDTLGQTTTRVGIQGQIDAALKETP